LASPTLWAAPPASTATGAASVSAPPAEANAAPANAAASTDDGYLDADFPEAKSLSVEPPIVGAPRARRASPTEDAPSSYPSAGDARKAPEPTGPLAVERGPFVLAVNDVLVNDYFSLIGIGVSAGGYLAKRLRVAAYLSSPFEFNAEANDADYGADVKKPKVLFGGTLGLALVRRRVFTLSLAADVSTTNSSDLGWNIGAAVPLEWVTRSGFRVGVTPSLVQNVGSSGALECENVWDDDTYTDRCIGTEGTASPAMGLHLQAGIGMTFK
jgi:hypothetical protein